MSNTSTYSEILGRPEKHRRDNTAYIELLLEFTWLIKGDTKEKELIKQYGKPRQQERYAYILMERLLQ